jgi:thymidylate kinase
MSNTNQATSIQERVYTLYTELVQAKQDKKDVVKAHGENIKRIEAEIKELLDEENDRQPNAE